MIIRKEIRSLSPNELLALRRAMIDFQAKQSYMDIAGIHGIPLGHCEHADLFLPWHRMYIFYFEAELRKIDGTVSLPFWDWTSSESLKSGIAPAHNDPEFLDTVRKPNPLFSGPIEDRSRNTQRERGRIDRLANYKESVDQAYARSTDYLSFNSAIAGPHGGIHVWVAGHMGSGERAAYDPIFWSHHANVDRQWALWQKMHPDDKIPASILTQPLKGFPGRLVSHVIDHESQLDYTYEGLQRGPALLTQLNILHELFKNRNKVTVVAIKEIGRPEDSIMVDLFIKNNDTGKEVYGGCFGIFGMSHAAHTGSHHHASAIKRTHLIDISDAIRWLGTSANIQIILRGVKLNGQEVKQSELPIEGITVIPAEELPES